MVAKFTVTIRTIKEWTLIKSGIPSAVRSLFYNTKEKTLYGLASRGREFTDLIKLPVENPKDITKKPLVAKIPFDPTRFKWEMMKQEQQLQLVLRTPLDPRGEVYKLNY